MLQNKIEAQSQSYGFKFLKPQNLQECHFLSLQVLDLHFPVEKDFQLLVSEIFQRESVKFYSKKT